MENTMKMYITADEVAELLGVSSTPSGQFLKYYRV